MIVVVADGAGVAIEVVVAVRWSRALFFISFIIINLCIAFCAIQEIERRDGPVGG